MLVVKILLRVGAFTECPPEIKYKKITFIKISTDNVYQDTNTFI